MASSTSQGRVDRRADLLARLESAWQRSDALFALVQPRALGMRPIALRNPLVFYVGHLPAFAWNMLARGVLGRGDSAVPAFDRLFEFGIDPEEGEESGAEPRWPALDEILRYRDGVRAFVRGAAPELAQRAHEDVLAAGGRILHLVLEHELMHHETLLYLLQELDPAHKLRPRWWSAPLVGASVPELPAVHVPAGEVRLGADFDELSFGWDNELPARHVRTAAFTLDALPVTVGRFAEFVAAGGYRDERWWSARGWSWVHKHGLAHPHGWLRRDGRWLVRTLFDELPLEQVAAWPACTTWAEADAFARWSGARLPSEPELVRAAYGDDDERAYPWSRDGHAPIGDERGNFGLRYHAPTPVGRFPAGAAPSGAQELMGNGWEWTATLFERHPGFEPWMRVYPGYSADFFDGAHYVLLGGSWATDDVLLRRSFRNWFRYNYPYPFTQFRLARDA